jgi:molecular chaperone GrpE
MEKKNPLEESEDIATQAPEAEESAEGKESSTKEEKRESAELRKALSQKEEELAEAKEKYLRMAAEYENYRKRSQKERDGIYTDAVSDVIGAILPIADNLERAAQFADGESVAKGVAMTLKGINDTLERLGITEIEAQGKPFDPEVHNAVLHVEDETQGESVVVEVLQKGYRKGDRVLRYAMVKVAN